MKLIGKLYKKLSSTKVQRYAVYVSDLGHKSQIIIEYGYVGKKYTKSIKSVLSGKNIGKRNETTRYEQAVLEAKSKLDSKLQDGYVNIEEELTDATSFNELLFLLPDVKLGKYNNLLFMKAIPFKHGLDIYPRIPQPKINGVRTELRWETIEEGEGLFKTSIEGAVLRAKKGLIYHLPHITGWLTKDMFYRKGIELVFDGELYIAGKALNVIRKSIPTINQQGTISKVSGIPQRVQFYTFDIMIEGLTQIKRLDILSNLFLMSRTICNLAINYDLVTINSDKEATTVRDNYLAIGYEGIILRDPDGVYQFGKRNSTMIKYKKDIYSVHTIVDIVEKAISDRVNITFVLRNDINDKLFDCTPIGTNEEKQTYLDNVDDYVGKQCEVKYYERSGVNKFPFHGNVIRIL